ncbi:membrane protein [Streptomyces minutiscleroticus]|uniref:Membrane protein n=1 Tax=Streptomyces minutiscleroticus TaxID=68238 RepID=A0A918NZH4_9ACTN|nr:DoxX family protein [Streptomyces minutiscleroticus]GGY07814.1 membrane protein [Streptomyces minutiscleroticus]
MSTAYVITVLTALANAGIAVADLTRAGFVVANSAAVGVPPAWLPRLAALKAAGAVGLLLGLVGAPVIGVAAATGLVLFFLGAVAAHVRARVFHNIVFPSGYLALAASSLVLVLTVPR